MNTPTNSSAPGTPPAPSPDTPMEAHRIYGRRLTFYHPNANMTGAAIQLELRFNRSGEDRYDCFFLEMARQKTPRGAGGHPAATFDWAAKVTVKLDFADICEFLRVLEGQTDQAGGPRGLYHEAGTANTLINLRHGTEPPGYALDISRKEKAGEVVFKGHILLTEAEGIGLRCVFQSALFYLAFHGSLGGEHEGAAAGGLV